MRLKQLQERYGIRRIDFNKVKLTGKEEQYASDAMVCPYCGHCNEYEGEETDEILKGTPYQCGECEKWFFAQGEIVINTTCTPIEDKVLEPFTRRCIEDNYAHMDRCDMCGCEWDNPFGLVEWETYQKYARPLFENAEKEVSE